MKKKIHSDAEPSLQKEKEKEEELVEDFEEGAPEVLEGSTKNAVKIQPRKRENWSLNEQIKFEKEVQAAFQDLGWNPKKIVEKIKNKFPRRTEQQLLYKFK